MTTFQSLSAGEPAPWFSAATGKDQRKIVAFDELAGRYIVLLFFGSPTQPGVAEALEALRRRSDLFERNRALLVQVCSHPKGFDHASVDQDHPEQLLLWDSTGTAAKRYGLAQTAEVAELCPTAFLLSPALQIVDIVRLTEPTKSIERLVSLLSERLAASSSPQDVPLLMVPQVFDYADCRRLIELYEINGGREIGRIESDGRIVERSDSKFRKRLDYYISDDGALQQTRQLLERRLLPMIYRAFQFRTTRIERYLVGCYDAETGGYFRPHRDNTAPPVAHRRFAVTINLNEDYEGGELYFPEFGNRPYRPPPGAAVAFSCSLLHEVRPVTRNRRYAFISFLYDESSQRLLDAYRRSMT